MCRDEARSEDFTSIVSLQEASKFASEFLKKEVSVSNISYLVQYGRVSRIEKEGSLMVDINDLLHYYKNNYTSREHIHKQKLGEDINWNLSFSEYREVETTKHVHRLHPYKGKFIPQLVEYFLDSHIDSFKTQTFFKKGDIVLDPFCGSGTTLIQANELGMNAIGVDVSAFNAHITNTKIDSYDHKNLKAQITDITKSLKEYLRNKNYIEFEEKLLNELKKFNERNFPAPDFRRKVVLKQIDEKAYGKEKELEFLPIYERLTKEYNIDLQTDKKNFLHQWFIKAVRDEIEFVFEHIKKIENLQSKKLLSLILSRTIRSCRATTHSDLATLLEPVTKTYYCKKHGKICKPLFSIASWWDRYSKDAIKRVEEFGKLKTDTLQKCLVGDSRNIDIVKALECKNHPLANLIVDKKIAGIFSSPPYVGLIDYHEQHAYAYDLFGFERNDEKEIGALHRGQGKQARESYAQGIAEVLNNSKKFLVDDYNIFLVANDKYNLYPKIAELANMKIVNQYKRPVLNRVEKDRGAYSETIFHLKENREK